MEIFVSWSGARSKLLGTALRDWLRLAVHAARPWMSDADILAGQRWNHEVAGQLEKSNFGILCVTSDNLASPWLLFEAGALAKSVQIARVVPVLLDLALSDLEYPLAQFQAVEATRDGILTLVVAINKELGPLALRDDAVHELFDALWPKMEMALKRIPNPDRAGRSYIRRTDREILEEVLETVRSLSRTKEDIVEVADSVVVKSASPKPRKWAEPRLDFSQLTDEELSAEWERLEKIKSAWEDDPQIIGEDQDAYLKSLRDVLDIKQEWSRRNSGGSE